MVQGVEEVKVSRFFPVPVTIVLLVTVGSMEEVLEVQLQKQALLEEERDSLSSPTLQLIREALQMP